MSGSVKARRLLSGVLWSGQVRWGKAVEVCCVLLRQGQVGLGMAVELWKVAISYGLGW